MSGRGRGQRSSGRRGRGRGGRGGRSNKNHQGDANAPNTTTKSNSKKKPAVAKKVTTQPPTSIDAVNGQKGAKSHTVSETDRIRLTEILIAFREQDDDNNKQVLEFPPTLTNTERKFVHELAAKLGLKSKSTGKGDERKINVSKQHTGMRRNAGLDDVPLLQLEKGAIQAMQRHFRQYPTTHSEDLEAHETGSSILEALRDNSSNNDSDDIVHRLQQLGIMESDDTNNRRATQVERPMRPIDLDKRRNRHAARQRTKRQHPDYERVLQTRAQLPAFAHQDEIVQTVRQNQVTIVSGDTGCGKSTQVPQFLLDANPDASIVVTQPRRLSAVSIAERVANEQYEAHIGGAIGYQVRLEARRSAETQLLFMTPGVLLRQMQSSPTLLEYSIIVIDEVHERDRFQEFLLIVLRDLLTVRGDLRVVLMSATLQTMSLVEYFSSENTTPAVVEMTGRMFPVQEFYLEHILELLSGQEVSLGIDEDERIEAELAKLLGDQGSDGEQDNTNENLASAIFGMAGFANGHEIVSQSDVSHDFSAMEAYDVENDIRLGENSFVVPTTTENAGGNAALHKNGDSAVPTDDSVEKESLVDEKESLPKWDGVGDFQMQAHVGPKLSETQEKLLQEYQVRHDDGMIDNYLLFEVLKYIVDASYGEGAILVFLPGWQEISEFRLLLETSFPFRDRSKYLVLPLHSGIPSRDQRRVLQLPPRGVRKIVLSTNIAETSLTIEDVAFVVDTGKVKEKSYDPHLKTSTLQTAWISQASSKQRRGRAGRTKAGVCFHIFSSRRRSSMQPFTESELLRTPLEELCLMCKRLDLAPGGPEDEDGVPAFLLKAMNPPHKKSIANALELLVELGAVLPATNDLTTLGECLAVISLHPRVGKMVIWSYILGCTRVACDMAVAMSTKSPFTLPTASMKETADRAKVRLSKNSESDQVTIHFALEMRARCKSKKEANDFFRDNFLSFATMQTIADTRKNLSRELSSLGFPDPIDKGRYHNRHDNDRSLWQASIAAGLYPNVALRKTGETNFSTMTNQKVKIHVSSINAAKGQPLGSKSRKEDGAIELMCFGEIVKGARSFNASQTTHLLSPLPILLLCGTSLSIHPDQLDTAYAILTMDDWIVYRCETAVAAHVVSLRHRLESVFWKALSSPSRDLSNLNDMERDAVQIVGPILRSTPNK